jgi:hypothetical protein
MVKKSGLILSIVALLSIILNVPTAKASLTFGSNYINTDSTLNLAGGNIGIGVPTPTQPLDVMGNILGTGHAAFGNSAVVDGNLNIFFNSGDPAGTGSPASIALNNVEVLSATPTTPGIFAGFQNTLDFSGVTTPASSVISVKGISNAINIGSSGAGATGIFQGQTTTVYRDNNQTGNMVVADGSNTFLNLFGSGTIVFARGAYVEARIGSSDSPHTFLNVTNLQGVVAHAWVDDEATVANVIGLDAQASNHSTNGPNVANLIAVRADADVPRHTDIAIGVQVTASNGTTATNGYGLKIDGVASTGNTAWGIYENGTWQNYFGGRVGIGIAVPQAALDVSSTTAGFLPPRMTTVQRDAISAPVEGLMIYNITTHKLNVFTGTVWEAVTSS